MFNFIGFSTFYFIVNIFIFNLDFFNDSFFNYNFFIYVYIFFITINYYFNDNVKDEIIKIDIYFKFLIILLKLPHVLINYCLITLKKIFIYLFCFKYKIFINTSKNIFIKYFYNYFIIWKPIFKKTSYFGYYRSNRSKWIK